MEDHPTEHTEGDVLDKLRRHIRILVDIGRLSVEDAGAERFLTKPCCKLPAPWKSTMLRCFNIVQTRPIFC